jgi:hypothetical protein
LTFEMLRLLVISTWAVDGSAITASAAGVEIDTPEHAVRRADATAVLRSGVVRKLREIFVIAASWSISSRLRGA